MYDLNFFSILKKQKQKNKTVRIIGFSLLAAFIIANIGLVGIGFFAMKKIETQINNNTAYINSPATRGKVRDADILNKETSIATNYLSIIKQISSQFTESNKIKVELMDYIRGLAPQATRFVNANFDGLQADFDCVTTEQTDPIHFYHQLINSDRFSVVRIPQINTQENNTYAFSIGIELKGEELK